jgi:hypothetical protein
MSESVANQTNPTYDEAAPAVTAMVTQLTLASTELTALKAVGGLTGLKRQSTDDIASLVAGIVTDVTSAVSLLGGSAGTSLVGALLPGLDSALSNLLTDVELLLAGVLTLVAGL